MFGFYSMNRIVDCSIDRTSDCPLVKHLKFAIFVEQCRDLFYARSINLPLHESTKGLNISASQMHIAVFDVEKTTMPMKCKYHVLKVR